ncbi:MAG: hypothetical protein LBH07_07905 [Treponema sp.]|jgi:hypothetical protein|nr:hypothetical protein [Treponema sp.]
MLVELFIFLTLVGTTALLFKPLMGLINKKITVVQKGFINTGESILNRSIHYESMSPSLLGAIEIRNLDIGPKNNPVFSAGRLFIGYSLWDLVRGKGLESLRRLFLEAPGLFFDTGKDNDLLELFTGNNKKINLPRRCDLIIKDGNISYINGILTLSVAGLSLDGNIMDGQINLEGSWQKNPSMDRTVTMDGNIYGLFSREFDRGSIEITIDSIIGYGFSVDRTSFLISFFKDRIVFHKEEDGLPITLSAIVHKENGEVSGNFLAESFMPESMVRFYGPLEKLVPLLGISLSGNANISLKNNKNIQDNSAAFRDFTFFFLLSGETGQITRDSPIRNFVLEGNGNEKQMVFSRFDLNAIQGSATYKGNLEFNPISPQGELAFSRFSISGDSNVNGNLSFIRTGSGFAVNSSSLALGETILSSFKGELVNNISGGTYSLDFRRHFYGTGRPDISTFESRGYYTNKPGSLEGMVELRNFRVSDLINLTRPFISVDSVFNDYAVKTTITSEIFFRTNFTGLEYRSSRFLASYGSTASLSFSLSGTEKQFDLSSGTVYLWQRKFEFKLNADFSDFQDIFIRSSLGYRNVIYDLEGRIQGMNLFTLHGTRGLSVQIANDRGQWSGFVSARDIPVPFGGTHGYISLETTLVYQNSAAWNLSLGRLEIREAREQAQLLIQGQANQNGLNLDRIVYSDPVGPLEGSAAVVWNENFSIIDGSFILVDRTNREKLAGEIFYEEGNLELQGRIADFRGERIVQAGRNFRISGEVFGGFSRGGYYSINLSLDSLSGRIGEENFSLSGLALLDPEQLTISRIVCSLGEVKANIPYVSLDRNAGRLETEILVTGQINNQELGLLTSLGLNFRPMKTWLVPEIMDSFSGILDVRYAFVDNKETTEPYSFVFTRTPSNETGTPGNQAVFRLSGGPRDMLSVEYRDIGPKNSVFSLSLGNPSPVQGTITGALEGSIIEALATEVFIDMAGLWNLIPSNKVVNFTNGIITGETRIFGSIFDLEFEGTAWGSGVTLTVPEFIPAEIGPGSGIITLEGNEISFGPVGASCGDGFGTVNGWIGFNRWISSVGLDITVERSIPFNFNISGVMASGNAAGNLNILMEGRDLITITGNVDTSNTEIAINRDEMEAAAFGNNRSSEADIVATVHITAGRRLEFLWPNPITPLLRAYGESRAGVRVMGDTRIPRLSMDGDILLRGGELYHLQRTFHIREGLLNFRGNDPNPDPLISASAESRDRNEEGPVTITLKYDKVPLSELEKSIPRYESIPSLSTLEIYGILGQAPAFEAATADSISPLLIAATDMIIQTIVFRRVEKQIRNTLGLDMFSFRTHIIQNALFEAVRNRDPEELPPTMGNYLDNSAVFIGKYIGRDLFFQTILAFRYDPYQVENWGIRPEADIGFDVRTPLFDVRWNIKPLHPENLFVNDQSISLVWRWSL